MKGEHEAVLDRSDEMSMIKWICGFAVKERKMQSL